jgi:hypothetical protein
VTTDAGLADRICDRSEALPLDAYSSEHLVPALPFER